MTDWKKGDLAIVKTTGEMVYVTGTTYDDGTTEIRRPKLGKDGISHETEGVSADELETLEAHFRREATETALRQKIYEEVFGQAMPVPGKKTGIVQ